ncbi:MAG TPA: hypothetical protein VH394_27325 [Thermoanaerobaculia bacterium]|nr:hypothetical protein [Thermoanaerobaculia bacterium]
MKNTCLVVLMLMLTVPALAADLKTHVPSCASNRSVAPVVSVADFVAQLNTSTPIPASTSSGGGGGLSKNGAPGNGSGIGAMCEEYWIECNNGTSDSCCGSLSSCWSYCEELCGGRCVYQEQ